MKTILLSLLVLVSLNLLAQERIFNNLNIAEDATFGLSEFEERIEQLSKIINVTQDFISENQEKVELMAIVGTSTEPISLPDRQWPDDITTSINVIRSENGNLTYYAEYPSSQSGDWFIGYRYYLHSTTGKVIAFLKSSEATVPYLGATCKRCKEQSNQLNYDSNIENETLAGISAVIFCNVHHKLYLGR